MSVGFADRLRGALVPASERVPTPPPGLRRASVLIPLAETPEGVLVILSRRTEKVPHHKGQVCFPGGSAEERDESLLETALREAEEEFSLKREDVRVIGRMDPVPTLTRFYITPYVGVIPYPYPFQPDPFEVEEIFAVPFSFFLNYSRYRETRTFFMGEPYPVYFLDYEGKVIWGATAKILRFLADLVKERGIF